ncbi:elongation factor 1-gamma-like [Megalops cyprinoides]|uniref:elongation factor 1-gamma-like n=1 Tax=Megalops cyprinoides TaxID=118141 RepID=UPI001865637C|nr:elongation factor 1-gamma-like [Megalops cyprinoides]
MAYSGVQIKLVTGQPAFEGSDGHESDHFLSKFPLQKVPAFEENGFQIQESSAIANYVANDVLRGTSPQEKALVQQWVNFAEGEIVPSMAAWVYPTMGVANCNEQASKKAKEAVLGVLSILNEHLLPRTFLVGDTVTLADISVVCALLLLYKQVLEPPVRQAYQNVTRWFCTCIHQPQFSAVLGDITLCEVLAEGKPHPQPEVFALNVPRARILFFEVADYFYAVSSKLKVTPESAEDPPKTEPSKDVVVEEEVENGYVFYSPTPPPPSSFILDEFKRKYSNEDTLTVALPYLWEKLDREGWSLWYSEYKYPSELGQVFMSCNLITGMFQRLDRLRKHAFASVALLGTDGDSSISGIWLLRGQELAFELCEDWKVDYESYSWRKLDPDSEETRTLVKEYLSWEGEFKHVDKPFNQGKVFK